MIVGLGLDLIEIERADRVLARWGERLIAKLMDPDEAAALPTAGAARTAAVARAITAKEAASKAIGAGWSRGVRWRDAVVRLQPVPTVELRGAALEAARRLGSGGPCQLRFEVRGNLVLAEVRLLA